MCEETKDVILYRQHQEGLQLSIVKSLSVSGALLYKDLYIAQLVEVKKCQDNEKTPFEH